MWQVELRSDARSTLERLAQLLPEGDVKVIHQDDTFFLLSTSFDGLTEATQVDELSREFAKILSGIAAVQIESHDEITTGQLVRVDSEGKRHHYVVAGTGHYFLSTLNVNGRGTIYRTDGSVEEASASGVNAVRRAVESALAKGSRAKAYRLRAEANPLWSDLYRILEVIETEVSPAEMYRRGWTTKKELRSLKHSADSVTVAGDDARHGREDTAPPAKPMSLREATAVVDKLLRLWERE